MTTLSHKSFVYCIKAYWTGEDKVQKYQGHESVIRAAKPP